MNRSSTAAILPLKSGMLTAEQLLIHSDGGTLWPSFPELDESFHLTDAYRLAQDVERLREQRGETPRGYKIGFTNVDMWARYGVTEPIWGRVWDSTVSDAPDGSQGLVLQGLCQPRIEPEVVFGLRSAPVSADPQDLFEAIDWIAPGFEIVQSHQRDWRFTAPQTVIDGGLHGRLVIGSRIPLHDVAGDAASLQEALMALRVTLSCDGTTVEVGSGAKVLGNPLLALGHLARGLAGDSSAADLRGDDVVTTGTLTDAWPVEVGQTWQAGYHGLLPDLSVSF